jgi:hypothetical protein
MKQKKSNNKNKKLLWLGAAGVLVSAALLVWLWPSHEQAETGAKSASTASSGSGGINYGPPTAAEKQESQNAKSQDVNNNNNQPASTQNGKQQVQIQVISATISQVRANVIGVFENGGKCTAVFTRNSESHSFSSSGITSVSYTQCEPINVTGVSGSGWTVVVSYSSSAAAGQSKPMSVN